MPNNLTVELPNLPMPGAQPNGLPLQGVTVLAVEDSRFASEALRLMCRRLGARLRRAESLQAAASHLKLYRPDLVIVDLGLPDGRGEALIAELSVGRPRLVVLGMSGDATGRAKALAAGAQGFVDKPLESLAVFRALLMRHLPERAADLAGAAEADLVPDALALRDDLAHAAALLDAGPGAEGQAYVAGFLRGVARHAHDSALADAAGSVRMDEIRAMLQDRLDGPDHAFAKHREEWS
ncbi:MAG: response regulator [Cypionkella sp.]